MINQTMGKNTSPKPLPVSIDARSPRPHNWTITLAICTAVITAAVSIYISQQVRSENEEIRKENKASFEVSNRAYVTAAYTVAQFKEQETNFEVSLVNGGNTPAHTLDFYVSIYDVLKKRLVTNGPMGKMGQIGPKATRTRLFHFPNSALPEEFDWTLLIIFQTLDKMDNYVFCKHVERGKQIQNVSCNIEARGPELLQLSLPNLRLRANLGQ